MKSAVSVFIFLLLVSFVPVATAQVFISEIMYDPQGGDTDHEWILVTNQGSSPVDLLHSKFIESGSNHGLVIEQGDTNLLPGGVAVIADNAKTFLSDYTNYKGIVLDSSFSLKNTGETISFKMPDGNISDTVSYSNTVGGSGDGNSLQKISGVWRFGAPSPSGSTSNNVSAVQLSSGANTNSLATNSSATSSQVSVLSNSVVSPQSRTVFAGVPVVFEGKISEQAVSAVSPQVTWSFGDGSAAQGATVSHSYYYPGEYTVIFTATSGESSATGKMIVTVILPQLLVSTEGDTSRSFFTIQNQGKEDLDVSGWKILYNAKSFVFPKNTVLSTQSKASFASEVTGLSTPQGSVPELFLPNGSQVAVKFETKNNQILIPSSVVTESKSGLSKLPEQARSLKIEPETQIAAVGKSNPLPLNIPNDDKKSILPWFIITSFIGALALLAVRLTRSSAIKEEMSTPTFSADDFEIEEEQKPY